MRVKVVAATEKPIDVISLAAGTCYGKEDVVEKRVWRCLDAGHMSVFEHASATFRIDGISRACANQLVRHRIASYAQESMRYIKVDVDGDWYVTPPCFEDNEAYAAQMDESAKAYQLALQSGIAAEDARFMLPLATKTSITMTVNLRELFTMFTLRMDSHAQWEIQNLFCCIYAALSDVDRQWDTLLQVWSDFTKAE